MEGDTDGLRKELQKRLIEVLVSTSEAEVLGMRFAEWKELAVRAESSQNEFERAKNKLCVFVGWKLK